MVKRASAPLFESSPFVRMLPGPTSEGTANEVRHLLRAATAAALERGRRAPARRPFALGNRPGALILVAPEWSARMHQQHEDLAAIALVEENSNATPQRRYAGGCMRSLAWKNRRANAESSPSLGWIDGLDAGHARRQVGRVRSQMMRHLGLDAGRPDDQDRGGAGKYLADAAEELLVDRAAGHSQLDDAIPRERRQGARDGRRGPRLLSS